MTGISVGDYRDPERGLELGELMREVAAVEGVERVRLSSVEVIHVRDSLVDALAAGAAHLPAPARSAPVRATTRVLASMGRNYDSAGYLRGDRAAARARAGREPDHRRDRRLPDRGRGRLRAHARRRARGRHHARAHVQLLGRVPGTEADALGDPVPPDGEEAPQPRAARPVRGARPPAPRGEARSRRRRCWSTRSRTTQASGYSRDYTRYYLPARRRRAPARSSALGRWSCTPTAVRGPAADLDRP